MWLTKRSSLALLACGLLFASVQGFVLQPLQKPMPTIRTSARDDDATEEEWHEKLEKLKERFDRIQGNHYDHGKMPAVLGDLPRIGIGSGENTVMFPVQQPVADWIKASGEATKAPFGKGEETVVDEHVRKTWQLEPESLSFLNSARCELRKLLRCGQISGIEMDRGLIDKWNFLGLQTIRMSASDDVAAEQAWHEKLRDRFQRIRGNHYEKGKLPVLLGDLPRVSVGGGESTVTFPVQQPVADWIKASGEATKAPFGKGEETLVDERVRKTWQLEPESVSFINGEEWDETVEKIKVEAVKHLTGEDDTQAANVTAKLHKVLLYEEGDFFRPHADSEKEPGMFATLSIQLPSCFTGGVMQIQHRGSIQEIALASDCRSTIQWVAWYADCIHEFQPIESGCRFVLVYNLIRVVEDNGGNREVVEESKKMIETTGMEAFLAQWKDSITVFQTGNTNNKDQHTDEELDARYYVHQLDHRYSLSPISREPHPEGPYSGHGYRVSKEPQLWIDDGGRNWLQCLKGRDYAVALECLALSDVVETSFLLTDFEYVGEGEEDVDVRSYQAVYGREAKEVSLFPRYDGWDRVFLTADRDSLEYLSEYLPHLLAHQRAVVLGNEGQSAYYFYRSAYLLLRHRHGDTAAGANE